MLWRKPPKDVAKVGVEGSNPFARSRLFCQSAQQAPQLRAAGLAEIAQRIAELLAKHLVTQIVEGLVGSGIGLDDETDYLVGGIDDLLRRRQAHSFERGVQTRDNFRALGLV